MRITAAALLIAIGSLVASHSCATFSPSPVPISHLPPYLSAEKVTSLESLLDTEAIRQTLSQYAYIIDARSYPSLSDIFTPNATANYSAPLGVMHTVEVISSTLSTALAQFAGTQHLLGSQSIRICDENTAISVSYFRAAHFLKGNGSIIAPDVKGFESVLYAYGQYQDTWVKRSGVWRIGYRNLVYMVGVFVSMIGARG